GDGPKERGAVRRADIGETHPPNPRSRSLLASAKRRLEPTESSYFLHFQVPSEGALSGTPVSQTQRLQMLASRSLATLTDWTVQAVFDLWRREGPCDLSHLSRSAHRDRRISARKQDENPAFARR